MPNRASPVSSFRRTVTTNRVAGTVSFTFSKRNYSGTNLSSKPPSNTQCDQLLRIEDNPGDNDDVFEPGETWVYTCSSPLTTQATENPNPGTTAWVWPEEWEDDDYPYPGSADGSGAGAEASPAVKEKKLSWWQRHLRSKRGF